ncbi:MULTISPECIES: hypothetical protein [unclassified Leifsonia]|uniref:hypothetical protein n=1 Tax=unclassified Leifsonia TaxID=2663824 RepID=UPI0003645379|nr:MULTISPECIES: hypothetical protein [unclassified Leifsonia]TDQ02299.1 hypothetical protein AXZ95_0572 [Leifsonia sp. 115AMFTsu3.1]
MSIAPAADIVHVWTDSGTLDRLVWRDRRYRIVAAEPIRATVIHEALTQPAERLIGWSLVAAGEQEPSEVRMMQIQSTGSGWALVDVHSA